MKCFHHTDENNESAQNQLQHRPLRQTGFVTATGLHQSEDAVYKTDRAENRQDINRVYGIRKNNKKDDNDADQSDISSPVKWFFLHKFQPSLCYKIVVFIAPLQRLYVIFSMYF